MEIWKDIKQYEGLYQVSDLGRVKSIRYGREKILKPVVNNNGYHQCSLKSKKYLVHRLVAESFLDNPFLYDVVNHKDENPANNSVANLEWCNHSYNQLYSKKRLGSTCYKATINEETALLIFKLSRHLSAPIISRKLKVSKGIVYKIAKGEAWNQVTGLPRIRHNKLKAA